jgi:hypothetical protein
MPRSPVVIEKQPWEQRLIDFDFSGHFATEDAITTATILTPERIGGGTVTLTVGNTAWSAQRVQALFSGGADGDRYLITCRANTPGERVELEGYLIVRERS